jgi:hypothetical protein
MRNDHCDSRAPTTSRGRRSTRCLPPSRSVRSTCCQRLEEAVRTLSLLNSAPVIKFPSGPREPWVRASMAEAGSEAAVLGSFAYSQTAPYFEGDCGGFR